MPGGQPTNWKIFIPGEFSHRSESSEPLGVWHGRRRRFQKSGFEGQQEFHRIGGNRKSTLGGHTKVSQAFRCREKSSDLLITWDRPSS